MIESFARTLLMISPALLLAGLPGACAREQLSRIEKAEIRCALNPYSFSEWGEFALGNHWAQRSCGDVTIIVRSCETAALGDPPCEPVDGILVVSGTGSDTP